MVFNPDPNMPAEEVVLTNRHIHIHLHLDFVEDSKMSYMNHIDSKVEKSIRGRGIIRRLYKYLHRNILL